MSKEEKKGVFSFLEKLKIDRKYQTIVFIVILSLIAIFVFLTFNRDEKTTSESNNDYVAVLETKLSDVLGKIDGAGKVSVMITVESGMETVLATKTNITEYDGKKVTEETPIIVNGKTVILRENYPRIVGVLVIAEGAGDLTVMRKIQQATLSVLDVSLKQVEILSMK